jgi:WD40 repeat protein
VLGGVGQAKEVMESLHSFVSQRQQGLLPRNIFSRAVRDSLYLVKRLTNTRVLEGHNGCVNSVSWNETGTRLISGSDDCHINIYDMATGLVRTVLHLTLKHAGMCNPWCT